MSEPVRKVAFYVPVSRSVLNDGARSRFWWDNWFRYGWVPPYVDPNPFPVLRLWRWWP